MRAVHDPDRRDHAAVDVVVRVEDQRPQRGVGVAHRRRDLLDDGVEQLGHAVARLARHVEELVGVEAEHLLDLVGDPLGLGGREVDLVEDADDLEVVLERLVAVGQRLGLDPLRRVDQQHHALAGGQRPRHLVAEVDVARACR